MTTHQLLAAYRSCAAVRLRLQLHHILKTPLKGLFIRKSDINTTRQTGCQQLCCLTPPFWNSALYTTGANSCAEGEGMMGQRRRQAGLPKLLMQGLKLRRSDASNEESERNNSDPLNCMISAGTPGMLSMSSSILRVHRSVSVRELGRDGEICRGGGVFGITWLICGG